MMNIFTVMILTLSPSFEQHWCVGEAQYLNELLLSVLQAAQLTLRSLSQLPEPMSLLLGSVDLVPHFLLQVLLLHRHRAVLLLSFLQSKKTEVSFKQNSTPSLNSGSFRCLCSHAPTLQVEEALLGVLQTFQILHHLRDVHLAGLVLHVGKPAAPDTDHYGNHQDEVFHPVMWWTCSEEDGLVTEEAHLWSWYLDVMSSDGCVCTHGAEDQTELHPGPSGWVSVCAAGLISSAASI